MLVDEIPDGPHSTRVRSCRLGVSSTRMSAPFERSCGGKSVKWRRLCQARHLRRTACTSIAKNAQVMKFIYDMVHCRQAGECHYNPMTSYVPSGMTSHNNREICKILISMNELRILSTYMKHSDDSKVHPGSQFIADVRLFGAHILEWMAPDRDAIA